LPACRSLAAWVFCFGLLLPPCLLAQERPSPTPLLKGRTVEAVTVLGNVQVPTSIIRNVIRTKVGDPYDPVGVHDDYLRIYDLK
jgi:hypothetical protein